MSTRILVVAGVAVLALVTACSSSKGTASPGGSTPPASAAAAPVAAVTISMTGSTLTGADGRTLYTNTVDTLTKISCTGECATEWPPVTGTPKLGSGLDASKFGTATRPDGTKQVTFNGHPLYEFKDDSAAGDKKGSGLADEGGAWRIATTSGAPAPAPESSSASRSSDDSSGGGGY